LNSETAFVCDGIKLRKLGSEQGGLVC
jgi:hypothetical protein